MKLIETLKLLFVNPKMGFMLILGFSAGLPLLMVYSTLSAWLSEADVSRSTIGFISWVGLAYGIKYLWSPLVDRVKLPVLTNLLGRRRSWLLLGQVGVIIGILGMAYSDPKNMLFYTVVFAVVLAFSSATQDIVIDAYRIDIGDVNEYAMMAAFYVYGYRIAMLFSGAGILWLADTGIDYDYEAWKSAYSYMAYIMVPCVLAVLFLLKEPETKVIIYKNTYDFFNQAFIQPFKDFFVRYGKHFFILLGVAITFRVSDLAMAVMANPFYLDIGFTKTEIAFAVKAFGFWMTIIGVFIGAIAVPMFGLRNVLLIVAILCAGSNLLFSAMSIIGKDLYFLMFTIAFDNLSAGMSTSVFITYLSSIVNKQYSATQYALLSSFVMVLPKFLAGFSGIVVDSIGYYWFWIITAMAGIPALIFIMCSSKILKTIK